MTLVRFILIVMLLAAMLDVTGKTALLVGGGQVALRRAQTLQAAGMMLKVVAPSVLKELRALSTETYTRPFAVQDLDRVALVVACTDDAAINSLVAQLARERGLWVNQAGSAEEGNLRFAAQWEQGGVQFAVNTPVGLPMLPQAIQRRLRALWSAPWPVEQWSEQRRAALSLPASQRQAALEALKIDIQQAVGL